MFSNDQNRLEKHLQTLIGQQDWPQIGAFQWVPIPFSGEWGISTSFFKLAAAEARQGKKVIVPQRAQEMAEQAAAAFRELPGFSHIEAVKGYLNIYFPTSQYAQRVVDAVLSKSADFGHGAPKIERVMVEYAQPNTHHSFHIGHYRNAILGEALARLMQFAGYYTIRASYPGDLGLGVITVLWAYQKFYSGQEPQGVHERGQWLLKLYVEASNLLNPNDDETSQEKARREAYDAERRALYQKWDNGDPEIRELWRKTREWSLEELRDILELLDIHMDVWFYESEVDEPSKAIVEELVAKGIADDERPDGPVLVHIDQKLGLKKEKYRSNILLRSDGTTLYLTKDLALAKIKFEQYQVDRSIYVVDVRQSMHLQQAFKILELWGFPQAKKCHHLGYGFVSLPEGAMSARRGRVVLFKDVEEEAVQRVLAEIAVKNPDMPQAQRSEVARQIGLGALAYAMLSVDNNKDIVFDMDQALNFDGKTGPYIQNAHVRANSILKKAGGKVPAPVPFDYDMSPHEIALIGQISRFPQAAAQAAEEYRPLVMASFAYDLASAFHSFYHQVPVLKADSEAIRQSRLRLVAAAKQTLINALYLLGIQAPDIM